MVSNNAPPLNWSWNETFREKEKAWYLSFSFCVFVIEWKTAIGIIRNQYYSAIIIDLNLF